MNVRPLPSAASALAAGIVLAPHAPPQTALLLGAAALALAAIGLRARPRPFLAAILAAMLLMGMLRGKQAATPLPGDVSRFADGPSLWVRGVVDSAVEERSGGLAFRLAVRSVNDYRAERGATGRLQVTVRSPERLALSYGDEVRLRGRIVRPLPPTNPDAFDYRAYLARRGIHALLTVKRPADVRRSGRTLATPAGRIAARLRAAVQRASSRHLPQADAALFDGLMLSIRGRIPADLEDAFSRTGTVHILSTSGMHLAVLAAFLLWLAHRATLPRRAAFAAVIAVVWIYALAAGSGPAVLRSAWMIAVLLLAPLLRRHADPLNSLFFAAFALLLTDPLCLHDAGTQLSFATTGTLLAWMPILERPLLPWEPEQPPGRRIARGIAVAFAVGLVAHLGSWPLVAYHFHIVSLIAPVANVPIAFLSGVLLVGGLLAVPLSSVPFLGDIAFLPLALGLQTLRGFALAAADLPLAAVSMSSPPVWFLGVYYLLLWGTVPFAHERYCRLRLFAPAAVGEAESPLQVK